MKTAGSLPCCQEIFVSKIYKYPNLNQLMKMTLASENGGHPFDEMPIEQIRDAENELDRLYQQNQGGMSATLLLGLLNYY